MASIPNCGVCKKTFKWKGPDPYLLPCLHAVCETCLTSAEKGCLHCPSCQRGFDVKKSPLQKDRARQKLILHLTAQHRPSELLCTHEDDGNQAVCWCQECEEFLCEHCQNLHEEFKSTRRHAVMSICELSASKDGKDSFCSKHDKYILEMFDKDCEVLICLKCKQEDHFGHSTENIDIADQLSRDELQENIKVLNDLTVNTQKQLDKKSWHASQLDCVATLQREKISHTFDRLRSLIDQRQKEITVSFEDHLSQTRSTISDERLALILQHKMYMDASDYFQIVIDHASMLDLPKMKSAIRDMIDEYLTFKHEKAWMRIVKFIAEDFSNVQKVLSGFARISNDPVEEENEPIPVPRRQSMMPDRIGHFGTSTEPSQSSSALTQKAKCIFQGKATYHFQKGSKQECNVKVFYFGTKNRSWVRMETLTSNQIILNHDINTMKLMPSFTPFLVTWKRPQPDGKGEDPVNLNFETADMAVKLRTVIQKIQVAVKKRTDTSSKPAPPPKTSAPFTSAQGSPAFKTKTPAAPAASASIAFSQSTSSAASPVTYTSVQQGQEQDKTTSVNVSKSSFGGFTCNTTPVVKLPEEKPMTSPTVKLKESTFKFTNPTAAVAAETQAKSFTGFSFTPTKPLTKPTPTSSSSAVVKRGSGDGPTRTSATAFCLGQSTNSPMPSFSNIANSSQSTSFTASGGAGFINAGSSEVAEQQGLSKGNTRSLAAMFEPKTGCK